MCDARAGRGSAAVTAWQRDNHYTSEPIFVPRPNATREDDGVVLSFALDGAAGRSYLLALDATTMQTIGTARMPVTLPNDVHGLFVEG